MARRKKAAAATLSPDAPRTYYVMPGVAYVDAKPVTGDTVTLTPTQARFDILQGRITASPPAKPARATKAIATAPEAGPDVPATANVPAKGDEG